MAGGRTRDFGPRVNLAQGRLAPGAAVLLRTAPVRCRCELFQALLGRRSVSTAQGVKRTEERYFKKFMFIHATRLP